MLKAAVFLILFLPLILKADDICFDMSPGGAIDDQKCNPVKVNIQYKDCSTSKNLEAVNGAMARFECTRKVKRLKYWHDNAMLFADLEKKGSTYKVTKTYATDYGRKDSKLETVTSPSSVVAVPLGLPAQASLPEVNVGKTEAPTETDLNSAIEKSLEPKSKIPEPNELPTQVVEPKNLENAIIQNTPVNKSEIVAIEPAKGINIKDIKLHGLVDFYYLYNLNQNSAFVTTSTDSKSPTTNVIYLPNTYHDQFTLNLAMLGAKKQAKPWGFAIDLAYGPAANHMAGGIGEYISTSGISDDSLRALNQAYVLYKTPFDVIVKAGRFHSYMGFESHYGSDNFNYTKSYGLTYLTPSLLQGVGLIWNLNDLLELSLYLTNGWDVHFENNRSKSFGGKIKYVPIEEVEISGAAYGGNENVTGNDSIFTVLEGTLLWKPSKILKAAVDFTGSQISVASNDPRKAGSLSGYVWWSFMEQMAVSLRYEMYTDDGLLPTGLITQNYVTSLNQTINSITATLEYMADENLKFKAEYRMDSTTASIPAFKDSTGNPTNTQSLAIGSAVLGF
ncbi:MAG: porin [Oligoflexia bacterium]|nr:porin [Oligoflexia bacterium]